MTVLEDAFRIATQGLDVHQLRERVVCFYVRRRGQKLAHDHPEWNSDQLSGALVTERAVVSTYVREKTASLVGRTDTKSPPHLDLTAMAKVTSGDSWSANAIAQALWAQYSRDRADWIAQIVWRAVALHDDNLWVQPMPPRRLETEALDEIVDRRLRVVERMACNVNSGGFLVPAGTRSFDVTGADGPWNDHLLVRLFEYPFLPERPFLPYMAQMRQRGWQSFGNGMMAFAPPGKPWVQVPRRSVSSWEPILSPSGTSWWIRFIPGSSPSPSEAIQLLFELGHTDFLDRNWCTCDCAGSALSVEALWFGRSRRDDGDTRVFDALMRRPGPQGNGYVALGALVGIGHKGLLMADANDTEFFESTEVVLDELQVGDFVVFWNNKIYDLIARGDWRNEFSYVMGVDADPMTGTVRGISGPQILLAGHGVPTRPYDKMSAEMVENLKEPLKDARERIRQKVDPTVRWVDYGLDGRSVTLVRWAPYEEFDDPGAWWVEIDESAWRREWGYNSTAEAVTGLPRTVAHDPAGGVGYKPPPDTSSIYFPLWEPKVPTVPADGDPWRAYLSRRKADPAYRAPAGLAELAVDAKLAPGLFHRGSQAKIPVVRPRVRR